jgi:hypothetical protein
VHRGLSIQATDVRTETEEAPLIREIRMRIAKIVLPHRPPFIPSACNQWHAKRAPLQPHPRCRRGADPVAPERQGERGLRASPKTTAIASTLMRYRDQSGQGWADIIDLLTMWPDARRRVARLLGEVDATGGEQ